jgi:hypothetical protein
MMPAFVRELVKPTKELAEALKSRMGFIREELLSQWVGELEGWKD